MDGENPTRRYKDLRPSQAARGVITLTGPTNNATLSLFNNSTGPHVLVVRAFFVSMTTAHLALVARQQGTQGTAGGLVVPGVSGRALPAGALYSLDTSTAITPDYMVPAQFNWPAYGLEFPFEVLQPGWSLTFQDSTANETMRLAILWEAIAPDELDFLDW